MTLFLLIADHTFRAILIILYFSILDNHLVFVGLVSVECFEVALSAAIVVLSTWIAFHSRAVVVHVLDDEFVV